MRLPPFGVNVYPTLGPGDRGLLRGGRTNGYGERGNTSIAVLQDSGGLLVHAGLPEVRQAGDPVGWPEDHGGQRDAVDTNVEQSATTKIGVEEALQRIVGCPETKVYVE